MTRDGYIIAHKDWVPGVKLHMAAHTFSTTPAEAWRRHIGPGVAPIDVSTRIQLWHDRGYRAHKATLSLTDRS